MVNNRLTPEAFTPALLFVRYVRYLAVMTPAEHVLACALEVERQHGRRAPVFVAAQIGRLALGGDAAGIEMWKQIAAALDRLSSRNAARNS